ncbi:hypothetical protein GA0070621_2859 [Micromonospora narathiwatensis]|uniref:SH3 domain-containing protein n=2 Tax=Micromonospora narathiwatensis TaxID=299146 RepID=A0A1A8ZT63_9ACTN|nr:hypothetical protein GA0070621_2859 [Micromonospora narathiwatensis]
MPARLCWTVQVRPGTSCRALHERCQSMHLRRRLPAAVFGAALVTTGLAAPAQASADNFAPAANCRQHSHTAKDNTIGGPAKSSVPIRSAGPYSDCSIDGYVASGTNLAYHCYVVNDVGNTWTWVRVPGTSIAGWVWDDNLLGYGSGVRC